MVLDEPAVAAPGEMPSDDFVAPMPDPVQPGVPVQPGLRVQPGFTISAVAAQCRPGVLFFATDSAELEEDSQETLAEMAQCLKGTAQGEEVTVRGRTDPRASEAYNEVLARQRATAVVSHLQTNGVDESAFEIVAIGEDGATEGMPRLHPLQRNATVRPQ